MWTLGLMGLILAAVFGLAAKFSFGVFDSRTKSALDTALAQLEKKFSEQMQRELETLRQQNSAQLKALEDGLANRIKQQEQDLNIRSRYQFDFAQGLAGMAGDRYARARAAFRRALTMYKSGRARQLVPARGAALVSSGQPL
jgi:uncharacterized phage infection (PIP) family protein YhgE